MLPKQLLLAGVAALPATAIYVPSHITEKNAKFNSCVPNHKKACLGNLEHPQSILKQAGCTIEAQVKCQTDLLPSYVPDSKVVENIQAWTPPLFCKKPWDDCLSQISIPYFNRAVCGKYLPVLCRHGLNTDEGKHIEGVADSIRSDFKQTLDFFHEHIPAVKAALFDQCLEHSKSLVRARDIIDHGHPLGHGGLHTDKNETVVDDRAHPDAVETQVEEPGPEVFFWCLREVKKAGHEKHTS